MLLPFCARSRTGYGGLSLVEVGLLAILIGYAPSAVRAQGMFGRKAGLRRVPGPRWPSSASSHLSLSGALLGGAVGVGVGSGVGVLLLMGAAELDRSSQGRSLGREDPGSRAASLMFIAGVGAIASGGPIGAVEGAGIEAGRWDAYIGAGFGEFVLGVVGYALAGEVHDGRTSRLFGLGVGMALGAGTGAYWAASATASRGLVRRDRNDWRLASPTVRIRPAVGEGRRPTIGVSILTVRF